MKIILLLFLVSLTAAAAQNFTEPQVCSCPDLPASSSLPDNHILYISLLVILGVIALASEILSFIPKDKVQAAGVLQAIINGAKILYTVLKGARGL